MGVGQTIFTIKPNQQAVQGFPINRFYTKAEADARFVHIGTITLAEVSDNSLTAPDSTYTLQPDLPVTFVSPELNTVDQINIQSGTSVAGTIVSASPKSGGIGYVVGDIITVDGGDENGTLRVDTIDLDGAVLTMSIVTPGTGYLTESYRTIGGSGDGTLQVQIASGAGPGALAFLNYGPGDQEIHFDVNWIGGEYIARNTTIAMIYEASNSLAFFANDGQTVGSPTTVDFNLPRGQFDASTGNFGVGTVVPASERLSVNGNLGVWDETSGLKAILSSVLLSGDQAFAFPDQSGILALTTDIFPVITDGINITGNGTLISPITLNDSLDDTSDILSIELTARILDDVVSLPSLDWTNRYLYLPDGVTISADWNQQIQNDSNGILSAAYGSRALFESGGVGVLQWESGLIIDNSSHTSINWFDRSLRDASSMLSADWTNRNLYDSAGNISVQYGSYVLTDASGFGSVQWQSRELTDVANNSVLMWGDLTSDLVIGDVNNIANGTKLVINDTSRSITLNATNNLIPILGGSGNGYVAVSNTGLLSFAGSIPFSAISSTPTTLAGYGITNAQSKLYSGNFSQTVVAVTTFTVTIGVTLGGTTYETLVTPTALLSAAVFYVNNKTTTTFDVVFLSALTGTVSFDWQVTP